MTLHIPLDFELREEVRLLGNRLAAGGLPREWASLYSFRLWLEFGRARTEWRPLRNKVEDPTKIDWNAEDLCFVIEDACAWQGRRADLMKAFIETKTLVVTQRGDLSGLTLSGFWADNKHLSLDFKTMQARGGLAKAAKHQSREDEEVAEQQRRLFESQGLLPLAPEEKATENEIRKSIAVIIRMDRACGFPMRTTGEYMSDKRLMSDALHIVRRFTLQDVEIVERYVHKNRENPEVITRTERILRDFVALLRKAN